MVTPFGNSSGPSVRPLNILMCLAAHRSSPGMCGHGCARSSGPCRRVSCAFIGTSRCSGSHPLSTGSWNTDSGVLANGEPSDSGIDTPEELDMQIAQTMSIPFVDLRAQYASIKAEVNAAIAAVLDESAHIGGRFVKDFEEAFASYCQVHHCVGVANGTDALFIALKALGIGAGDEVITAANTFIATSEAIKMTGAQVVFVDIDPRDLQHRRELESRRRSRGSTPGPSSLPVHLYGQPADMEPIIAVAHQSTDCGSLAMPRRPTARLQGPADCQAGRHHVFQLLSRKEPRAYGDARRARHRRRGSSHQRKDLCEPRWRQKYEARSRRHQQPSGRASSRRFGREAPAP